MKKYFRDILTLGLFVLVVGIFFSPTILNGKLPVPSDALVGLYHPWRDLYAKDYPRGVPFKNFLITDPVRQQIPWRKIAIDGWKQGKVPLWNSFAFSGTSLIGNIQAGVFYPFNILFFLFDFPISWTILIVLQPLLAGLFMYAFLRHKRLSELASLFGAVTWSFSGFSVAWLTWGTMVHVALWLPLILLAIDTKKFLMIVPALTSSFFAGHSQVFLYVLILSVAYAFYVKKISWFFRCFLIFTLISSIQWLPLAQSLLSSSRLFEIDSWMKAGWFLPWKHLAQYIAPDFFGNPATMNYWGDWNYGEFVGYIGVIGLTFALLAFFQKKLLFWGTALIITFLLLLPTPIAKLPYQLHIPILSSLQPTRLTVVVDFILAVLAAYGFDALLKTGGKKRWWPIFAIGAMLAILWLVAFFQKLEVSQRNLIFPTVIFLTSLFLLLFRAKFLSSGMLVILVGLSTFDQLRFANKFIPFTQREYFFSQTKVIEFFQKQPKPFRIMSLDKRLLPSNTAAYFGIETIEGYDPIVDSRYEEFFAALARNKPDIGPPFGFNRILTAEQVNSPLLPLLNVGYVLSLADRTEPFLVKVFQEGETRVYEDKRALPRIFLIEQVKIINDKEKIIDALYDREFNSRKTAIIEEQVSILSVPLSTDETANITSYESSSIDLKVSTRVPRLLVIANSWNQNWKVKIDGKMTKLLRTDYILQGVVVPEGSHSVELFYSIL